MRPPGLKRWRHWLISVTVLATATFGVGTVSTSAVGFAATVGTWHTLTDPIDPRQLTAMPFGTDSPWLQPWRSTLVTRPASALRDAIGINFNVSPDEAPATARLLGDSGFRRVRIEMPWNLMSYPDPGEIAAPARWRGVILALRAYHLRPLVLLNANSGGPGPAITGTVTLRAPAAAGARSVSLAPDSRPTVSPGLTGFDTEQPYPQRPGVLITSIGDDGTASLSRPLPMSLPAGRVPVSTLRFGPFAPPVLADGSPNPRFERTLAGWLDYVKTVGHFVRDTYGSSDFDMEVWNELSFGSAFLDEGHYYSPVPDPGAHGSVTDALLARTVAMLHDPANGLAAVRVGDGFSNQEPWPSGTTVPSGTDAIDKHPYAGLRSFPGSADEPGIRPLDALGNPNYVASASAASSLFRPMFVPRYRVFMPEYALTGIQTETLMRDLSPLMTTIYGTPHGALTHPAHSAAPAVWITEDSLDAGEALSTGMPGSVIPEFRAKSALRILLAYASAGAAAVDLFAAQGGRCCQFIPATFFRAVDSSPSSYPRQRQGLTMRAVRRVVAALHGAGPLRVPRQLKLNAISQLGNASQFSGGDTPSLPPLYDRDVLAFFPFQVNAHRFVCAVYVMTRDLTHRYPSHRRSSTPYDMPAEWFRLLIGHVDGVAARVSLKDPLTGAAGTARIVARTRDSIVVQLAATDSPRLLTIVDQPIRSVSNPSRPISRAPHL